MQNHLTVNYIDNSLKDYEKDILTLGVCDAFLRVCFIKDKNITRGIYMTENFVKLEDLDGLSQNEGLSIAINMIRNIMQTERHCIFSEELDLSKKNCFVNCKTWDVKFYLLKDSNLRPFREKLIDVMESVFELLPEYDGQLMRDAIEYVGKSENNLKAVLRYLERLRQEIS